MRVSFVLPEPFNHPIGGYKVAYEYANQLARRGHEIVVVHIAHLGRRAQVKHRVRLFGKSEGRPYRPDWFLLDESVVSLRWPAWTPSLLSGAQRVIATSWLTAEAIGSDDRARYFIQNYETWGGRSERVDATWRLPMPKIVIASWLAEKASELGGGPATLVPNAIDTDAFDMDIPANERKANEVAMLWHHGPYKGSGEGMAALTMVHRARPDLHLTIFSAASPPPELPDWVTFVPRADQAQLREIYNRAAVFVSPSHVEGWALPPAEAMACGASLVSTDIGGVADYALDRRTARLVPVGDVDAMANAVLDVMGDDGQRLELSRAGRDWIRSQFDWKRSTDLFERALVENI